MSRSCRPRCRVSRTRWRGQPDDVSSKTRQKPNLDIRKRSIDGSK
jgi:hypothetical protein